MTNDGDLGKTYKYNSIILSIVICIIITMMKLPNIFTWVTTYQWKYYMFPVLWIGVIWACIVAMPKIHPIISMRKQEHIYFDAMIYAMMLVGIQYFIGFLIYDIGKSPYDISPKGIWLNFLTVIVPFVAMEIVRAYILNSYCRPKNSLVFILVVVATTFIAMNLSKLSVVSNMEELTIYIAKDLLPEISKQILLTYLALYGGSLASICYGGLLLIFHWFIPVLPILDWLAQGVIGLLVPTVQTMFVHNKYNPEYIERINIKQNRKDTISWICILGSSVVLIWFIVGVFPVFPSVIMTGSMEPLIYPGDVIIVKQFYSEEEIQALQAGDIIYFQRDDIVITHRIVDVVYDKNGNYQFQTKGDNNSIEDIRLVLPQEVKGRYVMDIPKIGYPTYWLKSSQMRNRDDVEN